MSCWEWTVVGLPGQDGWSQGQEGLRGPGKGSSAAGQQGLAMSCPHRLKENYILLSTDGPGRNVLKFKPPMCFSVDNARHVVAKMDTILTGELGARAADQVSRAQPAARSLGPSAVPRKGTPQRAASLPDGAGNKEMRCGGAS